MEEASSASASFVASVDGISATRDVRQDLLPIPKYSAKMNLSRDRGDVRGISELLSALADCQAPFNDTSMVSQQDVCCAYSEHNEGAESCDFQRQRSACLVLLNERQGPGAEQLQSQRV